MFLKIFTRISALIVVLSLFSCNTAKESVLPSWYVNPKNNDSSYLYGVGDGFSLHEAKSSALNDLAGKLSVVISSDATLISEENKISVNEELRRKINQSIARIDFSNVEVANSTKIANRFYVEIRVVRSEFIANQEESIRLLERKIANLERNIQERNIVSRRNSLLEIIDLSSQVETSARVLRSLGSNVGLENKLHKTAEFQAKFNALNDKIEFFVDAGSSSAAVANVFANQLNKNGFKMVTFRGPETLVLRIKQQVRNSKIYESYLAKLTVTTQIIVGNNTIATASIETTGGSTVNEKEAYYSAAERIREMIEEQGILKVLQIN